jgi:hypothetical protein
LTLHEHEFFLQNRVASRELLRLHHLERLEHVDSYALVLDWLLQSCVLDKKHRLHGLFVLTTHTHKSRFDIDYVRLHRRLLYRDSLVHFMVQIALLVIPKRLLWLHPLVGALMILSAIFVQELGAVVGWELRQPLFIWWSELRFIENMLLLQKLLLALVIHMRVVLLGLCNHLLHQFAVAPWALLLLRSVTAEVTGYLIAG